MTDGPRTDDPTDLPTPIDNSETTLNYITTLSDAPITESTLDQNTSPLTEATTTERPTTTVSSIREAEKIAEYSSTFTSSYVTPVTTRLLKTIFSKNKPVSTASMSTTTASKLKGDISTTDYGSTDLKRSSKEASYSTKPSSKTTSKVSIVKSTMGLQSSRKTDTASKSTVTTKYETSSLEIKKSSSHLSSKVSSKTVSVSTTSRSTSLKYKQPQFFSLITDGTKYRTTKSLSTSPAFSSTNVPQSSISYSYLESTKEPVQTMGAGALVIVVLLPFLALFLIAIVTALRRKMKKSGNRIRRYQNRNAESKFERNHSQVIPLTKIETND